MPIVAGQKPPGPVGPTRRTNAPRKRGDDTRAKIIDETVRCIVE
ncbi:MAG: TetR/AcrR family transcriptional regulator, partial [Mycobacterium sp.]